MMRDRVIAKINEMLFEPHTLEEYLETEKLRQQGIFTGSSWPESRFGVCVIRLRGLVTDDALPKKFKYVEYMSKWNWDWLTEDQLLDTLIHVSRRSWTQM